MMKVLYITDRYAWDVYGVKRSLYETLAERVPVELALLDTLTMCHYLNDIDLYRKLRSGLYTHAFFAHTTLCFPRDWMQRLHGCAKLVGFGFSDPRWFGWTKKNWDLFDHYITLSATVAKEATAAGIPATIMLPSVHEGFHDQVLADHRKPQVDAVFLGATENHPDSVVRRDLITRAKAAGLEIRIIRGTSGTEMLRSISKARIGLNAMQATSTLPHRLFEYAACGVCIASTPHPTIDSAFEPRKEYIPLGDLNQLKDVDHCAEIAAAGRRRCLRDHTMRSRVDAILKALG